MRKANVNFKENGVYHPTITTTAARKNFAKLCGRIEVVGMVLKIGDRIIPTPEQVQEVLWDVHGDKHIRKVKILQKHSVMNTGLFQTLLAVLLGQSIFTGSRPCVTDSCVAALFVW